MSDHLDIAELLKIELGGKKAAMGRYDEILWKIRSGYMLVLAGALGFFVTGQGGLVLDGKVLFIIIWFSAVGWTVDITYRLRQLRVVRAYNELVSSMLKNLPGDHGLGHIEEDLFHISGEKLRVPATAEDITVYQCMMPSALIYLGTCTVATLLMLAGA